MRELVNFSCRGVGCNCLCAGLAFYHTGDNKQDTADRRVGAQDTEMLEACTHLAMRGHFRYRRKRPFSPRLLLPHCCQNDSLPTAVNGLSLRAANAANTYQNLRLRLPPPPETTRARLPPPFHFVYHMCTTSSHSSPLSTSSPRVLLLLLELSMFFLALFLRIRGDGRGLQRCSGALPRLSVHRVTGLPKPHAAHAATALENTLWPLAWRVRA